MRFKLVITVITNLTLSVFVVKSNAQGIAFKEVFSQSEFDSMLNYSQNVSKPAFIYFYSPDCAACGLLSKNVFSNSNLALTFNLAFTNIKVNFESDFGIWFFEKYKIQNLPSYFFADPEGHPLSKIFIGNIEIEQLKSTAISISGLFSDLLSYKEKFYSSNADYEIVKKYGFVLHQLQYYSEANTVATLYFNSILNFDYDMYEWQLLKNYLSDINLPLFKRFLLDSEKFKSIYGQTEVNEYLTRVFDYSFYKCVADTDTQMLENTLQLLDFFEYRNISKAQVSPLSAKGFFKLEFLRNTGDINGFLVFLEGFLKENNLPDEILNDYLLELLNKTEDVYWLVKINEWSAGLYKKHKNFNSTSTYAVSCISISQKSKALKLIKKAERFASNEEENKYLAELKKLAEKQ